jgi:ABC-type multidrug transport system ATPase subunit
VPIENKDREVKWLFEKLEYDPNNSYKRFNNLSGGNKRKLCMMMALYGDPALRLLDECSTGLDPSSRLAMVETIKYSKRGTTVFTTHSMSEAEDLCTKAVIMSKGSILEFDLISRLRAKHFDCCWVVIEISS